MIHNVKTEPIHSIVTSKTIHLQSMQVFDMQGLLVKQDKQIRELSKYVLNNCRLTIDITAQNSEVWFAGTKIATVEVIGYDVIVTFEKPILNAIAYANGKQFETTVNFDDVVIDMTKELADFEAGRIDEAPAFTLIVI